MDNAKYLLSICIPTYNRSQFLEKSLAIIKVQQENSSFPIEVIISDNCSTDNTEIVVKKYIEDGMKVRYIRNDINKGMDANFVQCFREAQGKYLWLLGDDEMLYQNAIDKIVNILSNNTIGVLHILQNTKKEKKGYQIYNESQKFISDVSFWITFISANIVNSKYAKAVEFSKYQDSLLSQVPLYLTAAFSEEKNIVMNDDIFEEVGGDFKNNGGYNVFNIFGTNYLNILKDFRKNDFITFLSFEKEKYFLLRNFLMGYVYNLLILRKKSNFQDKKGWQILLRHYKYYPYFYFMLLYLYIRSKYENNTKNT